MSASKLLALLSLFALTGLPACATDTEDDDLTEEERAEGAAIDAEESASTTAALSPVPACVTVEDFGRRNWTDNQKTGYLHNRCSGTVRVRVVIGFWFDTNCMELRPKTSRPFSYGQGKVGRIDRLERC